MVRRTKHELYNTWAHMRFRCKNENHRLWHRYGGRGINVCEEWDDFQTFLEDMGPRPTKKHSIDRIDNDLGYYKDNCRWATQREQQLNRGITVVLNFDGVDYFLSDLAKISGLKPDTIKARHANGMNYEDAMRKTKYVSTVGLRKAIDTRVANQLARTHCKHGHEFTPENTGKQKNGRFCRKCHALKVRRQQARKKSILTCEAN